MYMYKDLHVFSPLVIVCGLNVSDNYLHVRAHVYTHDRLAFRFSPLTTCVLACINVHVTGLLSDV